MSGWGSAASLARKNQSIPIASMTSHGLGKRVPSKTGLSQQRLERDGAGFRLGVVYDAKTEAQIRRQAVS